jgi:tetratricopeptide (TPR) repeat protein
MDVTKKVFGEGHPRSILAASKLGMLIFRQNKAAEAEVSLNECLKAYSSLLCEDSTETAELASSLATLCTRLGRWKEAESLMKEAKQICERICGADDIRTKSHAALLRVIELKNPSRSREQQRASSAIEAGEQATSNEQESRAINQEVAFGLKDMFDSQMKLGLKGTAIQSLQTAALLSINTRDWPQAETQLRQLLAMLEEQLGPQDQSVGQTSFMLGTMLLFQQKLGATDALQRAISILERQHGSEHVGLASPLALLALASGIDGRSDEAERYFDRCRSIREKSGTLNSLDFIGIAKKHALFLRKANREEAAKKVEAMLASSSSNNGQTSTN